ncbi:NfeD family protein [Peptostreptococcus faecalis]|uniref:NfeD family protein n=1 Tax=Peptostreptococcus faecalis TaxID=2045015 RepID=UPI000C79AE70|nr:NfeD family protein [Peptostreptococcus faecalis]
MKISLNNGRQKDFLIILLGIVPMIIFSYLLVNFFNNITRYTTQPPLLYVLILFLIIVLYVSYLEARDKDDFVTGKTQTLGVNNSFTGALALSILFAKDYKTAFIAYITISILILIVREFGRYSSKRKNLKYLNKEGILITPLNKNNRGKALINDMEVNVYSLEKIDPNTKVYISDIRGNYLFISKVK